MTVRGALLRLLADGEPRTLEALAAALGALSLAAGVATLRALARLGVNGLSLKWPNDVLKDGGKLGGILSELRLEAAGPAYVVVGVVNADGPVVERVEIGGRIEKLTSGEVTLRAVA